MVCDALKAKGLTKPDGAGYKWWVGQNGPHIASIARSPEGVASVHKKRAPRAPWSPTIRHPKCDPASIEFLQTFEWRAVRMQALKRHGARCQCCGASPANGAVMHVDHIKPRKLFPQLALDIDNLQVLCHECNHGKGNWDQTDWRNRQEDDPSGREVMAMLKSIARGD
jgi:5-methylcytosine-specific restriction endonuclease McrA